MDNVEDLHYKYKQKSHKDVVNITANHVSNQRVHADNLDAMKKERFGCVFIQEPNEVSRDFISTPVSILIKYHQPKTDRISGQFKLTTIRNFVYVNNTLVFSISV